MAVGGEIGVGGGARFTQEVEGGGLDIGADGQSHNTSGPDTFLRKGVLIGCGAVFELRFSRGRAGERGHDGEDEKKREKQGSLHGGHPGRFTEGSHRI